LYIFDEPTTGLHFVDIQKLLTAFRKLIDGGASILVIEHNLDIIKSADWIIDLGPEGGEQGGHVVATGTPEQVARNARSHTGKYLARVLDNHHSNGNQGSQKQGTQRKS
jgi:excinuclease ABC subunit A